MFRSGAALGALAMLAMLAAPVAAQDQAVYLFARGGGVNDLTDLNDMGSLDLNKTGYSLGVGAAVQVQKYVTLRTDFTYTRSTLQQNSVETGRDVARYFYDAALQLQYPFADGLEPYVFAGGGGVTIQHVGTSGLDATKGTFTYGLGLSGIASRSDGGSPSPAAGRRCPEAARPLVVPAASAVAGRAGGWRPWPRPRAA